MSEDHLPVGKLPLHVLRPLLEAAPVEDPDVVLGPGVGLDCAVVRYGGGYLVFKSDPITFATDELGWYLVHVNSNDIATTGATPRWLLVTLLLPEGETEADAVQEMAEEIYEACRSLGISVIGGHTEITYGLSRPLAVGTLVGQAGDEKLITPLGARAGDRLLLTKGVPIEATAIVARELSDSLRGALTEEQLDEAAHFLHEPGISVLRDAQVAVAAGRVTAMHDPTEGGLAAALWELAEACGQGLQVDVDAVIIPALSEKICRHLKVDPLAAIASGALLLTVAADDAAAICEALEANGIACAAIGEVLDEPAGVWMDTPQGRQKVARPERDEIARLFEAA